MNGSTRNERSWGHLDSFVPAARTGDSDAIAELLHGFDSLLRSNLRRHSGERLKRYADIEDLVQEVHISLIGGLDRLRDGATANDFRKQLLLHARWVVGKLGRRSGAFDGESVAGETPEPAAKAISVGPVTLQDRDEWLAGRVRNLDQENATLLSGFLAGKSFPEMGKALGISEDAARKRFLRASARLADSTNTDIL